MARLPQGVRKRPDGKLEKRFTISGKRYSVYGATTKEIQEKEQELRDQIKAGAYTIEQNLTLETYFYRWLRSKEVTTKESTQVQYKSHMQLVLKYMGNKKLSSITRENIIDLQNKLVIKDGLASNTVNHKLMILRSVLNEAVIEHIILNNPALNIRGVKASEPKATETNHRALTVQEQKLFMQALKSNYLYHFIAIMLNTGMRYGEVAALTWNDIDYEENVIHVTKTISRTKKDYCAVGSSTKTPAGVRDIPMLGNTREILKEFKAKSELLPFPNTTIFTTVTGKIVDNMSVNRAIEETLLSLDDQGQHINHFSSHALRDTFATRCIESGMNPKTLQKILGHSSIDMTMNLYAHVMKDTMQEEMNRVRIVM